MKHTLIVLPGPTGVGKTELAIELAHRYGCDIISCDSRQFYREMKIGTAAPSVEQMAQAKHHFIGFISVTDYYSVSLFERDVMRLLPSLFAENPVTVMTGGSMLYMDAVCRGMDDIPDTDPAVRQRYAEMYSRDGIAALRIALKMVDPDYYARVDLHNPRRILRALEITESTGRPYSSFLTAPVRERNFRIIKAGLTRERGELYRRIDARVDRMIGEGLEEEARSLMKYRGLNALNTVGYREMFRWFDGEITREEAIMLIRRNTRRYARKQITWWNRDSDISWFDASEKENMFSWIEGRLKEQ
ncbi:MAG: tRNA (adenosine(37)-N6)-dimethylallyltransferase MiaA [Bacteroidales bacterium]|jgi:tRNA dimethylallyltransferase|nr:tRNA (adenosine(37)-N6)-dimethylallyltransferase MiaA [Bacteroidales bacterium]MDD3735803.1 tRNA (adenosine(37)-N6)-dimethylallyltransferase MiaA [Bacteroidales bacterium]NLD63870.1 tRNA (adenosine(37)-N6)-dimethylallyltransferase MiaA [Bacteroidales bacterium]HOO66904.1 tRNA (adenosine(37)-N6)-dimethylallyltransferase MiaA [Bacteroidales bacterium]HPE23166.1 tRNA (adenosine(37)-N6)-dimethylallyltransferase MiaA [Bacteroidales bacterium]